MSLHHFHSLIQCVCPSLTVKFFLHLDQKCQEAACRNRNPVRKLNGARTFYIQFRMGLKSFAQMVPRQREKIMECLAQQASSQNNGHTDCSTRQCRKEQEISGIFKSGHSSQCRQQLHIASTHPAGQKEQKEDQSGNQCGSAGEEQLLPSTCFKMEK